MSNELAEALRRFADDIDKGVGVPTPTEMCIVIGNEKGVCSATYIGRKVPARDAGTILLTNGIQRMVMGMSPTVTQAPAAPAPIAGFGSTHRSTH